MELISTEPRRYPLRFNGAGSAYFAIVIVNWLLTLITLGLYYPWAKARTLRYLYGSTQFDGDHFVFSGTGKEMFVGFVKAILLFLVLAALIFVIQAFSLYVIGLLIAYLLFFAILPLMVHGSYRYRMSRTSWRGIRFGYQGNKWELFANMMQWMLLTVVSLGVYAFWMTVNLRRFLFSNIHFGNATFVYNASGTKYFWMCMKGYFLSIITLGIYAPWWMKDLVDFYIEHTKLEMGERKLNFKSSTTGFQIFVLMLTNLLLLIFSLGIAFPWVEMRTYKYFIDNICVDGDINTEELVQTQAETKDATADEMADFFDIDFVV